MLGYVASCLSDLVQVLDECQAALGWLEEKQNLQDSMKKTEDPVLVTADIKKKEETLSRVADPILSKPAPKPKVNAVDTKPRSKQLHLVHNVTITSQSSCSDASIGQCKQMCMRRVHTLSIRNKPNYR